MLRAILGILLTIFSAWVFLLATGWELIFQLTVRCLQWFRFHPFPSFMIALVTFMIGLFFLRQLKPKPKTMSITSSLHAGKLTISPGAIEDIVNKSLSKLIGIHKINALVALDDDGAEISVLCQMDHGYELSLVSAKIQEIVRQKVEYQAEIRIKEVKVLEKQRGFVFSAWKK
jgi:uncharacterized alkaline shock family protein YloU